MLTALCLPLLAAPRVAPADGYTVPEGFAVETVGELARSFLALTFDGRGRLFVSVEGGPILWLDDRDHDGRYEASGTFDASIESAQGLLWIDDVLWAVGQRKGDGGTAPVDGLFRLTADAEHASALEVRPFLTFVGANGDDPPGEHGAHGLVAGPDGALYLTVGNHARLATAPVPGSPLQQGSEGTLLTPYFDPLGHAVHVRYPCGYIARIDPRDASWRYVCVGLRNAYDLAFDAQGELFTFDSDMEWDVGLPWYRATRFLHVVEGADFGSRTGSYPWPEWYDDTLPPIAEAGRGSPTGVVVYEHTSWPARYRGAVLAGDWSRGRILALHVERAGAGFRGEVETLLEARQGFNVTDLDVGPDGALYFVSGGRGAIGRIERLVHRGPTAESAPAAERAGPIAERDALIVAVRALDRAASASSDTALAALDTAALDPRTELRARAAFWLGRRLTDSSNDALLRRAVAASRDPAPEVRAEALRALALARATDAGGREAIFAGLQDADRHVRYAARFAWERAVGPSATSAPSVDPILWARRWLEDRRTPLQDARESAAEERTYYLPFPAPTSTEAWLTSLRSIELALEELGPRAKLQGQRFDWDAGMLAAFPHADRRVSMLLASVLAMRDVEGARVELLVALDGEVSREQQIHYARCLVELARGWTDDEARRLFAWFDAAEGWPDGGASFGGYLRAMRARFAERFDDDAKLALARAAPMGGRTLADFARAVAPERVDALVPALKYAWVAVADGGRDEAAVRAERVAILRALGAARSRELASWLRKLADESGAPRDEVLRALAEQRDSVDARLLVEGLASDLAGTVEACVAALESPELLARGSEDSREPLAALAAARRLGAARGSGALRLAARRLGATPTLDPGADWNASLANVERAFRARFPEVALGDASSERGPRFEVDALTAFLERSAARRGSTARGKQVFERASCSTCHVVEGTTFAAVGTGVGPELSTVGKRFDTRALVEAVLSPSRVIADLYRTTVVITHDEERLEGRVVRDDEQGLELVFGDGTRSEVAREEIAEVAPSSLSLMPEGLLAPFDWEDAKDLFAFLAAGRALAEDDDEPFEPLFAGKARNLWNGDRAVWQLDGELIVGKAEGLAQNSYLTSKRTWSDFELAFDVKLSAGANSGVQLRSRVDPGVVDPIGLQADLGQSYWGAFYATDGRGLVAAADPRWREIVDPTGWNHVFVRCAGERWTFELNGLTTAEVREPSSSAGVLAFQVHQGLAMEVRVTHARLRELSKD